MMGKVHLYVMKTDDLNDPRDHEEWDKELPAGRWEKAVLPISPEDRRNSAGAGWLLRYVFYKEGIPLEKESLMYGKHGKPRHESLHFNLSHSGVYVICAVGEQEIGCDIQKLRPCKEQMVRRFFTPDEQEYIFAADGSEQKERFVTLWCRKESFLKRTGEGLIRELNQLSCLDGTDFYEMKMGDYIICICGGGLVRKRPSRSCEGISCEDIFCGDISDNVLVEFVTPAQCLLLFTR